MAAVVAYAQLASMIFFAVSKVGDPATARPLTIYSYWYWYGEDARFAKYLWIALGGALVGFIIPALFLFTPKKRSLHGDAKWAGRPEIKRIGLFNNHGVIVGQYGNRMLMHAGTGGVSPHVYLAAPTGSGKTQGVMLPNLLNWPGSVVALDIKGELYARTAGYRAAHGQAVHYLNFSPRDGKGDQYNPFEYVSDDPDFRVGDIAKITAYLIPLPEGDPFWVNQGRQLFLGLALYFYGVNEVPTLPKIRNLLLTPEGIQAWCRNLIGSEGRRVHHPECLRTLGAFAASAENTATGIRDTVASALLPVVNEVTAAILSGNSFDLRTLRSRATSIYLVVMPPDREQVAPLVRLFFQQLVDLNSDIEFGRDPSHKHRILLAMDEFATIGRVPAIAEGIAYIRSYGFTLLSVVQSPSQLNGLYRQDAAKAFTDNFGCTVFYTPGPRDLVTAEEISKILGFQTVAGISQSKRTAWTLDHDHKSQTTSDQRRALMLPQEVLRLPQKREIVIVAGANPILGKKLWTEKHRGLAARFAQPPVPAPLPALTPAPSRELTPTREPAPADMANLNEMTLDDFSLDFSDIEIPGDPMTPAEIEKLCSQIYAHVSPA